jgi:GNAT superfamily N-acetyltransferase
MTPEDLPGLAELCREMQRHYRESAPPRDAILAMLAALPPGCEALVARVEGRVAGVAFFGVQFPGSDLKPVLFLKDLFVGEAARGRGAARALMQALAAIAVERGCYRVDWTTSPDNHAARALYDGLGAVLTPKIGYSLDGDALAQAARPTAETGRD